MFQADRAAVAEAIDADAFDALAELLGDALGEVVDLFLEDAPLLLGRLNEAIVAGDAQNAARLGHTLKGSAANLGMLRLSELCQVLEAAAKDGDTSALAQRRPQLQQEYRRALAALDEKGFRSDATGSALEITDR